MHFKIIGGGGGGGLAPAALSSYAYVLLVVSTDKCHIHMCTFFLSLRRSVLIITIFMWTVRHLYRALVLSLSLSLALSLSARYDVPLKITTGGIPYQIAKMLHH